MCGGAAGITSVFFTYPLDIVRTRLSIQSASFAALGQTHTSKLPGMWATLAKMYKTEGGILALYRGIIPTVAGVAPYVSSYPIWRLRNLPDVLGWPKLHDLRNRSEISYSRGGQASKCGTKACSGGHLGCCSPDMYLSLVSATPWTYYHLILTQRAMCFADVSKSTPCLGWDISTNQYPMLYV